MLIRNILNLIILISLYLFLIHIEPGSENTALIKNNGIGGIPYRISEYHGKDMLLEKIVYKILDTPFIIHRTYSRNNENNIFLSIVYYPNVRVDFHEPDACLAGQGIEILKKVVGISFNYQGVEQTIKVNRLVRKENSNNSLIYYFYKAGDYSGSNYLYLRIILAISKFTSAESSGSLIRISIPITNGDIDGAEMILIGFLKDLYPFLVSSL